MNIKDLEITKELSLEERAVRGGGSLNYNGASVGGPTQVLAAGPGIFDTNLALQVFTPTQIETNVAPVVTTVDDTKIANAIASMGTLIGQK